MTTTNVKLQAADQLVSLAAQATATGGVRVSLPAAGATEPGQTAEYEADFAQVVELRNFLNQHIDSMAAGFAPGVPAGPDQQDPSLDNRWEGTRIS